MGGLYVIEKQEEVLAIPKIQDSWLYKSGSTYLVLEKSRGRFTIEQIEDFLRYQNSGKYQGNWAVILRCGEQTCDGSGWDDGKDPKGDIVRLIQLGGGETCPVCNEFLPSEYCPHCGNKIDNEVI